MTLVIKSHGNTIRVALTLLFVMGCGLLQTSGDPGQGDDPAQINEAIQLPAAPPSASPTPMDTGSSPSDAALPFEGLWIRESEDPSGSYEYEVLAITARSLYWVRGDRNGVAEEFYEIASHDLQNSHITLIKRWIRHNGISLGFDYNPWLLTYAVQGDELRITTAGENEFPAEAISGPYYRK